MASRRLNEPARAPAAQTYTGGGTVSTGAISVGPGTSTTDLDEGWDAVEQGAYFESFLYPRQAGARALGIYFVRGRLGALFFPAKAEHALLYRDVTHQDFVGAVEREHQITLAGSRIDMESGRNIVLR